MDRKNSGKQNTMQSASLGDWVNESPGRVRRDKPNPASKNTPGDLSDMSAGDLVEFDIAPAKNQDSAQIKPRFSASSKSPSPEKSKSVFSGIPDNIEEMDTKDLITLLSQTAPIPTEGPDSGEEKQLAPLEALGVAEGLGARAAPGNDPEADTDLEETPTLDAEDDSEDGGKTEREANNSIFKAAVDSVPPNSPSKMAYSAARATVDGLAARFIFDNLPDKLKGVALSEDNFYRAMNIMPIFWRKRDIYGPRGSTVSEAERNAFETAYAAVLPKGTVESVLNRNVLGQLRSAMDEGDKDLAPAKRIEEAMKTPKMRSVLSEAGQTLGKAALEAEPGTFIAAHSYISGGNYMDLQDDGAAFKEQFCKAYGRFVGEHLAENVAFVRSGTRNGTECVTMLRSDGVLVDYDPAGPVPEGFAISTIPEIKGMSGLHDPADAEAGFVENECFIVPDGSPARDVDTLSFLLAPDGGLVFTDDSKEFGGSLPYAYFQFTKGPCIVTLKDGSPLPLKEFRASFLRSQPTIRMLPGQNGNPDTPILLFLPPDGSTLSKGFLKEIFDGTEPLRISLSREELDTELDTHDREPIQDIHAGMNIKVAADVAATTLADVLSQVNQALQNGRPEFTSEDIIGAIPLEYVERISRTLAGPDTAAGEFTFYRA